MDKFDFIRHSDVKTIEDLYKKYLQNPDSVDTEWQYFFKGFDFVLQQVEKKPSATQLSKEEVVDIHKIKEFKVINLIQQYRKRGHLFTKTNPVRSRRKYFPTLDIENFGLSEEDLSQSFQAGKEIGLGTATLLEIISHLEHTYCKHIGVEFIYITTPNIVSWLKEKMESSKNSEKLSKDEKMDIFHTLKRAVGFEQFIHHKFLGQKRFSLEGSEALMPAMDALIKRGVELGIKEIVVSMTHRGRLNMLANILKKPYENIFYEFEGESYEDPYSLGDVKYHLGYSNTITIADNNRLKISLVPNSSHLESALPVAEGISRAILEREYMLDYHKLVPIIIHGDAAIAGQGVVYEVVQMAKLDYYKTGGTIHIVINNQIGFTTSYLEARSSAYCTDVAKVTKSPVFHVNGDKAEDVVFVAKLAMEFRQQFHSDVFIDLLSYRKYGHNEGDEPRFTQPLLYKIISQHSSPRDMYKDELIKDKVLSQDEAEREISDFEELLEQKYLQSKKFEAVKIDLLYKDNSEVIHKENGGADSASQIKTEVSLQKITKLFNRLHQLPDDKKFFRKAEKLLARRKKLFQEDKLDWAIAELLAYASLATEGYNIRLSGQDTKRGTFSHRHAVLTIEDSSEKYYPLQHLSKDQANCTVLNSPLNEYASLGYEYGYSLGNYKGLTIWEAQFGDFHNVAQPIIDQYISSSEDKWGIHSGLVLYLPHGYEGQGAEHSSARIERFLILCANNNMQVCNPTTPGNFFHLLRRQARLADKKPLILFSPKSLFRHPLCTSSLNDLAKGSFNKLLDDDDCEPAQVKRIVFCSGKIYYDLLKMKNQLSVKDIALVRIEQLYPFPLRQVKKILNKYDKALLHLWVQEEPENMGAWNFIQYALKDVVSLIPVARLASSSPAVGLHTLHKIGQEELIQKVFRKCDCELNHKYCALQCAEGKSRKDILAIHHQLKKESKFILK